MEEAALPRVLIISVNPLSDTSNNGKTYASFFAGYPSDRLAQLYFHRELPTASVTDNYFRVSDEDVLRFTLGKTQSIGVRVSQSTTADQLISPVNTRRLASSNLIRLARAAVMSQLLKRGYRTIIEWLQEFDPQIIFFSGGNATQLYPLVERISDDYRAPVVNYVTDDYVLPSKNGGPLEKFARRNVRRHFLRICKRSARVLTIGQKMSDTYEERFSIASTPLMNLVDLENGETTSPQSPRGNPVVLCYAGGLHLNRWQTLAAIGASLDRLEGSRRKAELHIYTSTTLDKPIHDALSEHGAIHLKGSLDAGELQTVYKRADLLVHVESFNQVDREATLLSISTKIPEYLAAGRAIVALGPADVASIEYLKNSGAAFTLSSLAPQNIDALLRDATLDDEKRDQRATRARIVAHENHDSSRARANLWSDLLAIVHASDPCTPQKESR